MAQISVIVPVYNASQTISRCIDSILRQSYSNFEIVLINDGSSDHSLEILREYEKRDLRVKVIDSVNEGVSRARNKGIEHSVGRYLVFVDSDDYVEDHYLKYLYENVSQGVMTLCAFKEVYETKSEIRQMSTTFIDDFSCEAFMRLYDGKLINSPCNKIYDATIVREHHILFDSRYSLGEDLLFNLDYMENLNIKKFRVINEPLLNYMIINEPSLSKKFHLDEIQVQTELFLRVKAFINDCLNCPNLMNDLKDSYYYALLYRFDGIYRNTKNRQINQYVKETFKTNTIASFQEMMKTSKNVKLKIKLAIAYYFGFDIYYRLFGYK